MEIINKIYTKLYVLISKDEQNTIFSGITFKDFLKCTPIPIKNILLPKAIFVGNKYVYNFELLEGENEINKLLSENIRNYGDFYFIDYEDSFNINDLKYEHVAEILY